MPDVIRETFNLGSLTPRRRRPVTPALLEAAALMRDVFAGDRVAGLRMQAALAGDSHSVGLSEAMSTSDFPILFGDVLDRELLTQYEQWPTIWTAFARRTTVRDFKPKKYYDLIGGRGVLDRVPELTEYPARSVTEELYELAVAKFGGRIPLSWETMVNDDLGAFRDLPERLAQAARDTEDHQATSLLVTATGPRAPFFHADNNNILTGNPALSEASAEAALTAISTRRDQEGRPIMVRAAVLMVPPELQVVADRIVGATEIRETIDGKTIVRSNPLAGRVTVVVNPWLTMIDQSANAATTWFMLPAPTASRPAVVVGFLSGHESPDLRYKADAGSSVGGGQLGVEAGSFDVDDIQYRVRHVLGGTTLEPIATAVSNGSGA